MTERSQKSQISTQMFAPSNLCDSPFGWYHCSSSQQITTNKPAVPEVTGMVTGRWWQSVWGYLACWCRTAASFPTRHNSPTQFWLPCFWLPLPCQQQCQNKDSEEKQKELNMAEQGALLEKLPFKCLPSSSRTFHPRWERSMLRATTGPQDLLQGEKRHLSTCSSPESHHIRLPTQ